MCRRRTGVGTCALTPEQLKSKRLDKALMHVPHHMIVARVCQLIHRLHKVSSVLETMHCRITSPTSTTPLIPHPRHLIGKCMAPV